MGPRMSASMHDVVTGPVTPRTLVIREGIAGTWRFHLAPADDKCTSLCGKRVMFSGFDLHEWGVVSANDRITYRWCAKCEALR